MKRKEFGSTHDEALSRLCFVCGEIIKETFFYAVDKHLDLLAAALKCPGLLSIPDVTPLNFCKKCHVALSMVKNGGTVKTGRTLLEWEECSSECKTCGKLTERKQVRGRHKKVKRGGRPKLGTWSLTSIPTPEEFEYDIDISLVRPHNSEDALKHCLCIYCDGLLVGPIMLKCEHGSCYRCFVDNNFKKPIQETVCLTCEARIGSDSDIKTSGFLQTCIDNLNSKCNKGSCGEVIPLRYWSDHTNSCTGQPKSITPMIGKEMRAQSPMIGKEMRAQSQNGRIEIPTGGQYKRQEREAGTSSTKQNPTWKPRRSPRKLRKVSVENPTPSHIVSRNISILQQPEQNLQNCLKPKIKRRKSNTEFLLCRKETWEVDADLFENCCNIKFLVPNRKVSNSTHSYTKKYPHRSGRTPQPELRNNIVTDIGVGGSFNAAPILINGDDDSGGRMSPCSGSSTPEWATESLRQMVLQQIEEATCTFGRISAKTTPDYEQFILSKAQSRDDYIQKVAWLIHHIQEVSGKPGTTSGTSGGMSNGTSSGTSSGGSSRRASDVHDNNGKTGSEGLTNIFDNKPQSHI